MIESRMNVAVLITCHNRKEKTLKCLDRLCNISLAPDAYKIDVFLVDDGSVDGTGESVSIHFPQVKVIQGDGSLYWNQGMRLAWENASEAKLYDFYCWLNDDTLLFEFALNELVTCYNLVLEMGKRPAIITGACKSGDENNEFSYGGRTDSGPVLPNGELQKCKYINGNVVLISRAIFDRLGNLSGDYTHGMGDFDYGLRANQAGFNCYTTREYVAICPRNEGIPNWCNPQVSLSRRWELLHSPNGLNLKEYNTFRQKFWGKKWIIYAIKAYLKVLFPQMYMKISNKNIL